MPELYLYCPSGISGDMFLAAMADLGVDFTSLQSAFARAGMDIAINVCDTRDKGIRGKQVRIEASPDQPLRHLDDLSRLLDALPVSDSIRTRTRTALRRLAEVEAEVHCIPLDQVHFHEIGAIDTIVDVLGAFWALESLDIHRVTCSHLPWFTGSVLCAHGVMPLPAPATAALLSGKPVYPTNITKEIITPTGALILDQIVSDYVAGPTGWIQGCGLGLGSLRLENVNGLRAVLVSREPENPEKS